MNLSQFETQIAGEIGLNLNVASEKQLIDDSVNQAVQRVLEDTHCYVIETDFTGLWDGVSSNFTLNGQILEIVEMQLSSTGTTYPLERLSIEDLLERRRVGQPTGTPTRFYAVSGANLLMFYPAPGAGDTLTVYNVPVPEPLAGPGDDPSAAISGGVPTILHEAIKWYACMVCASFDDDQTSAQGQRYRDWYKEEITRYKEILRKRGGTRNARAVVNGKRVRRPLHDNSVYPRA